MDEPQTSLEPQSDPAEGEENAIDTGGETDGSAQVTAKEEEKPKWVTGPVPGESEWSGGYVWSIERFSKLREWKICSAEFDIGTYTWRILVFPFGYSNYCHRDFVSVSVDYPEAEFTPYKICPTAKFEMTAINQEDDKQTVTKGAEHKFTWQAKDWGFAEFLQLEDAVCTSSGFVTNDNFIVTAKLTIFQDPDLYGLVRKETGFVGLKTQDAVSYRNSLLQCLYHLRYVRKLVYQMPVEKMEDRQQSTLFALQRIFYQLQYQNWSVSTRDLVKSFDSEICDPFLKHDIREMQSILCQKIEERMKGTEFEGCASELFIGRYSTYVESKKPKFSDARETTFTELELDVKGCKNVYEALEKFCQTEQLEGPNNYPAKKLGLKVQTEIMEFCFTPSLCRKLVDLIASRASLLCFD